MFRDRVIVICISGLSGTGGMDGIRDKLHEVFVPHGVNPDNIFRRSWNKENESDPSAEPWVDDLNREINRRTELPTYLAIIGHSYGGWAACRLSKVTNRVPDFVALIDPVFGPDNIFNQNQDYPRGNLIRNWYQTNSPVFVDPCTGIKIPCTREVGLHCGYSNVPGAHENIEEAKKRNWWGNHERTSCPGGRKHEPTSHIDIDSDQWIWRQISNQIYYDIIELKQKYVIKSVRDDKYLSIKNDKIYLEKTTQIKRSHVFTLEHLGYNDYVIKASNEKYVSAEDDPNFAIYLSSSIGVPQIFNFQPFGRNVYAIKASNTEYLTIKKDQLHQFPNLTNLSYFEFIPLK
ncbi:hypothetical protein [Bacillus sp. 7884-1]|uniref:hypothetical protein n=1 Tax=Bacillus sp. 7884-1 TaxID=2021693 RepID=UPI000BA771A4|nr:hypothetical protein [Bacillus sp. 7884-1]PAE38379.1 hypothetical protein CHI06_18635 [Bacillus sp. 7884-1]